MEFVWYLVAIAIAAISALIVLACSLWTKGRIGRGISLAIFLFSFFVSAFISFKVYVEIYPLESFYKNEFMKVTGLDFPASGRFLFKEASYASFNGDYESCALIEVSAEDYLRLRTKIPEHHSAQSPFGSSCMDNLTHALGDVKLLADYYSNNDTRQEMLYWGLVTGKPRVFISYFTW